MTASRLLPCLVLAFALVGAAPPAAMAISLDEARAAGYVGERYDGYVAVVDPAAPREVRALVEEVNAERRKRYQEIAEKRRADDPDVTAEVVGRLAAERIMRKLPPGALIMGPKGDWEQR